MTTTKHPAGEGIAGPERAAAEPLDTRTVAERLGCSARHGRRVAGQGVMPRPVRLGGLVRWRTGEPTSRIDAGCPRARDGKGGVR